MASSPLPLRGKTLPTNFTYGWVQAYFDILWVDIAIGNFNGAFGVNYNIRVKDMLLYLYYECACHQMKSVQLEPIDYWFFEQTRKGLNAYIGERAASDRSMMIGFEWWSYLNDIIGHNLIPPHKFRNPSSSGIYYEELKSPTGIHELTPPQFTHHRIGVAARNFAKKVKTAGGILTQLDEIEGGLYLTFPQCPFCANELPKCNILFGLVQGMLMHQCGIQPVLETGKENELLFKTALHVTQRMEYRLVDGDSHSIQLMFTC